MTLSGVIKKNKNSSIPTTVVIGNGVVGNALHKKWMQAGEFAAQLTNKSNQWYLDLSRGPDCWRIPSALQWVFIAAGITSREECEKDPWRSRWVNVVGGIRVARYFEKKKTRVVFFGTDLLPEEGEYARQKEELRRAMAGMSHCYYIRLSKVIHPSLPIFQKWEKSLRAGNPPEAFPNVMLRPISPEAVAECAWQMAHGHPLGNREASWQPDIKLSYLRLANQWLIWKEKTDISANSVSQNLFQIKKNKEVTCEYKPFTNTIQRIDAKKWWNN